jgi:hypothetical protein
MRKHLAIVSVLMLLCGGLGSSALLARAFAQSKPLSAVQQEKRIGPKPIPHWYLRWVQWRLGEGYAKGHALTPGLRPSRAPRLVPRWAWRRLHFFLLARLDRLPAAWARRHKTPTVTTKTSSTTTDTTTTTTGTTTTPGSGGGGSGGSGSVAPPAPPGSYSVPNGVTVSNSAQLEAALAAGDSTIILADGTYAGSTYFTDWQGSSLYAQHPLGATLTAGLMVGGNGSTSGAVIRGLAFDVTDPSTTFQNSEVNIWGSAGEATQVLDSTFDGNWTVGVGLLAMNSDGLVAQRDTFAHFTDEGIRASDNQSLAYGSATMVIKSISDISVNGVSRSTPGASGGTAEAGLWIGEPVANGVHRIRIRDVAWSGIETVNNSWDTTFSDLDIDMSGPHAGIGVAVYLEHYSRNDTFTNFVFTAVKEGFNAEWDDGTPGNEAARDDTIENGTIDAGGWTNVGNTAGVYLDEGTGSMTITGVTFKNENWAAIGAYKNSGTNTISNNTYQLAPGAVQISHNHI